MKRFIQWLLALFATAPAVVQADHEPAPPVLPQQAAPSPAPRLTDELERICQLVMRFEGCSLKAYPDPGTGGAPWTIGWGETLGVKQGDVWTQKQADDTLRRLVGQFMLATLKRCPQLHLEPPGRTAACTSLAYNIGVGAFGASSVCRHTTRLAFLLAADSFLLWNKAAGRVMRGLTNRRKLERTTYLT